MGHDRNTSSSSTRLTAPEVAKLLRVSPEKIRGFILRGELLAANVAERLGGRPRWRISPADLDAFLAARSAAPPSTRIPRQRSRSRPDVIKFF